MKNHPHSVPRPPVCGASRPRSSSSRADLPSFARPVRGQTGPSPGAPLQLMNSSSPRRLHATISQSIRRLDATYRLLGSRAVCRSSPHRRESSEKCDSHSANRGTSGGPSARPRSSTKRDDPPLVRPGSSSSRSLNLFLALTPATTPDRYSRRRPLPAAMKYRSECHRRSFNHLWAFQNQPPPCGGVV